MTYRAEIERYQPEFAYEPAEVQVTAFILRNAVPAGLFIGEVCDDNSLEVKLDFVVPQYRDFKAGAFLYSTRSGVFEKAACDRAWTVSGTADHVRYLERMGFEAGDRDGVGVYTKDITDLHQPPPPADTVPYVVPDS